MAWTTLQSRRLETPGPLKSNAAICTVTRTPCTHQPQTSPLVDPKWIARGLTYLSMGNGLFWTKELGWTCAVTITGGPRNKPHKYDISKGYGATDGSGTTDRLDGPPLVLASGWRSIVSFSFANSQGGGTFGRILNPLGTLGNTANDEVIFISGGTLLTKFFYRRNCSNASGSHHIAGTPVLGVWKCYGVTHDQRTVGQTPALYEDGTSAVVTLVDTSTGTFSRGPYTPSFGNRDSTRNWDGLHGPCMFFDHPTQGLTVDEHKTLYGNPWQIFVPQTRAIWIPNV